MTITTYPDGHSVQQGTPEELAQFIFAATEVQTLQKFKSLVEAIPAETEKQRDVVVTIPDCPRRSERPERKREKKMEEKRLVDANHFMQVLKNIEYALKGELTHGKIKTSVVQMIEGSLNAEPTIAPESLQPLTYNENRDYVDCDEFICHKCGIHVEDWKQIKIDPDDGEKELCEYTFKHCPECGAKVTLHKSCEFCRWHLRDGTCFNKHHSQPVTGREASCWNWEERE
jgi:hypothetical protein